MNAFTPQPHPHHPPPPTPWQALCAGLFVGATVLLAGATRLIDLVGHAVPLPVVRGVQLQVGCKLALKVRPLLSVVLLHPGKPHSSVLLAAALVVSRELVGQNNDAHMTASS